MATLHLFFYVFLSVFELGGVAVSASFAENKNYKKKKIVACPSLQTFQGQLNWIMLHGICCIH